MDAREPPGFAVDVVVDALEGLARLYGIAFDRSLVRAQLPATPDAQAIARIAGQLGLTLEPLPRAGHATAVAAALRHHGTRCALAVVRPSDGPAQLRIAVLDVDGVLRVAGECAETDLASATQWFSVLHASAVALPSDDRPAAPRFGFRWFVPELLRHRRTWRDVTIASLLIQLLALGVPVLTQVVVDKVVVHHTVQTLWVVLAALVASTVFGALMGWVRQTLVAHVGTRIDAVLGDRVFRHLLGLPLRWFEQRATGNVVSRLQGVETVREFLTGAAVSLVLDVPFALLYLVVMASYSGTLTLVALAALAAIALVSALLLPVGRRRLELQMRLAARNQGFVTEMVAGAQTLKALQMEPQVGQRFGGLLADYLGAAWRTRQTYNGWHSLASALEQAMGVAILAAGAWTVMHDPAFTIGMLVAFQMFASRLAQPVMRIVGLWQEFQQAALAVERLSDVMDATPEPVSFAPTLAASGAVSVSFAEVRFRYAPDRPLVLDGLDLELPAGSCTALTGPSGSGKSTIARLLQGFEFCESGRVEVAGRDTRTLAANELRALLGVVPQDTTLFAKTVWENLVDGAPQADFERVVRACRVAEVHDVIEQLPAGYQTPLGERGLGLSGGQRQRIAIARALLRRPAILVFDEATSGLDVDTAAAFARTVNRLRGKVTLLFIAHHVPPELVVDHVVRLAGPRRTRVETLHPVGRGAVHADPRDDASAAGLAR
jgi:subfamily B ATP-binding cassette protein HlyB/CyaB